MNVLIIVVMVLALLFGAVLLVGAPYLPTLSRQANEAVDLLGLEPGQTMLELGSGDGRVLWAAARRGIHCIGYEINPVLALVSWIVLLRYRKLAHVKWANYWQGNLPPADGVYTFLLDKFMPKLDKKLKADFPDGIRLVSYAFAVPGRSPTKEAGALKLYVYNPPRALRHEHNNLP